MEATSPKGICHWNIIIFFVIILKFKKPLVSDNFIVIRHNIKMHCETKKQCIYPQQKETDKNNWRIRV